MLTTLEFIVRIVLWSGVIETFLGANDWLTFFSSCSSADAIWAIFIIIFGVSSVDSHWFNFLRNIARFVVIISVTWLIFVTWVRTWLRLSLKDSCALGSKIIIIVIQNRDIEAIRIVWFKSRDSSACFYFESASFAFWDWDGKILLWANVAKLVSLVTTTIFFEGANWELGCFAVDELVWAVVFGISQLRTAVSILATYRWVAGWPWTFAWSKCSWKAVDVTTSDATTTTEVSIEWNSRVGAIEFLCFLWSTGLLKWFRRLKLSKETIILRFDCDS